MRRSGRITSLQIGSSSGEWVEIGPVTGERFEHIKPPEPLFPIEMTCTLTVPAYNLLLIAAVLYAWSHQS
jgi:hypothetical protein